MQRKNKHEVDHTFSHLVRQIRLFVESNTFPLFLILGLWVAELLLNVLIIERVPYTEIDWVAYMEEVEGVIQGERDYEKLKGCTGPLVYPAGFVWIYSALYYLTNAGRNIYLAQYVFAALYMATITVLFAIYTKAMNRRTMPIWILVLLCLSRRVHSIFVLRLFNDCVAMFLCYVSIYLFTTHRWTLGTALFSVAVSVKMNVLLFLPPLAVLMAKQHGVLANLPLAFLFLAIQVGLGLPFLLHDWWHYIKGSFDLGRVFLYKWTVNWKFLPENIFVSRELAMTLLGFHLLTLLLFFFFKWRTPGESFWQLIIGKNLSSTVAYSNKQEQKLSANYIVTMLFAGNFIGIFFARSLHYQFYVWYFHTLPFLLWHIRYPTFLRLILFVGIEVVWNIYPSNAGTSLILLICHSLILVGLIITPFPPAYSSAKTKKETKIKKTKKIKTKKQKQKPKNN